MGFIWNSHSASSPTCKPFCYFTPMSQCCRCNSSGRCVNCKCVKAGLCCKNCLPSKHGLCQNQTSSLSLSSSHSNAVAVVTKNMDAVSSPVSSPVLQASSSVSDQTPLYQSTISPLNLFALPPFVVSSPPNFIWSDVVDGADFIHSVTAAYAEIVHWKHNLFLPPSAVLSLPTPKLPSHPVIFDSLDGASIRAAALHTNGSAGPSGLDALCWRRLCTSFQHASNDLCNSLALVARKICTTYVDPQGIAAFTANRLIALDKCPGVRPIGVGETVRRIISKAVLSVIKSDVLEAAGSLQLCAGHEAGCEAAIHSMCRIFHDTLTEAVLLVDAKNAFNSLNRKVALLNIHQLCPSLATILTNTYRENASLFIDGDTLFSQEGTTQGDPLAMAMYAVATVPLIEKLQNTNTKQVWYADDATAGGTLLHLKAWWTMLSSSGPSYGYFVNPGKTWLIVKPQHEHV